MAPVLVTCNFDHTVRVVSRKLTELRLDCYLLVAPTGGMNVWCASAGGHFGAPQVAAAIKLTRIADLVDHRSVTLPQLAAPGMNVAELKQLIGWSARFGPVEIADLPSWLGNHRQPVPGTTVVRFPLRRRLEMGIGAGLWPAGAFGVPVTILNWHAGLLVVALSYVLSLLFAAVYPRLPLSPGIPQAVAFSATLMAGGAATILAIGGTPPWLAGAWLVVLAAMGTLIAIDFPSWSPTDVCKQQIICFLYPSTLAPAGYLPEIDAPTCIGCDICVRVCPKGALALDERRVAVLTAEDDCMGCYACAQQCPVDAISKT